MASITIRNLDDVLKRSLRIRAAEHGRSMEEEVREIIRHALAQSSTPQDLGQSIHQRFAALGGIDFPPEARTPTRELPDVE